MQILLILYNKNGEKRYEMPNKNKKEYKEYLLLIQLSKRKQQIQRILMQKRMHDKNPITWYDLSGIKTRYGRKKQRCWYCVGKTHKNNSSHSIKISQLQRFCWELHDRFGTMEKALNHSIKPAERRKWK